MIHTFEHILRIIFETLPRFPFVDVIRCDPCSCSVFHFMAVDILAYTYLCVRLFFESHLMTHYLLFAAPLQGNFELWNDEGCEERD